MRAFARVLAVLAMVASPLAFAQQTIPLTSGTPVNFTIGPQQFSNAFVIDVTTQTQLRLELVATNAGDDVDILLRYGSPFPDRTFAGLAPSAEDLYEVAQYRSASVGTTAGSELIVIGDYNRFPVRAGRWYVSIINYSAANSPARITATLSNVAPPPLPIEVVFDDPAGNCDLSGWNDSTARAPVGGNNGTTLGQQRRNALLEAVRLIGLELKSPIPVRMQACWADQGTGDSVTLASAGPRALGRNDTVFGDNLRPQLGDRYLTRNYTSFASAPTTKLAGARLCAIAGTAIPCGPSAYDLRAQFNINVDGPNALGSRGFYYGLTQATSGTALADTDFISVAMHELLHGLGFIGLVNKDAENGPIGARFAGFDDIYSANIARLVGPDCPSFGANCQALPFLSGSDADRFAAMTGFTTLRWTDPAATQDAFNPNRQNPAPYNGVTLHAPDPKSTARGRCASR
jgi:hypothetical protein